MACVVCVALLCVQQQHAVVAGTVSRSWPPPCQPFPHPQPHPQPEEASNCPLHLHHIYHSPSLSLSLTLALTLTLTLFPVLLLVQLCDPARGKKREIES